MSDLRIGSLFSGYGGLDMGVQEFVGGSVAWHVEFDPAPSKVLAHHWPNVPNYGDVRTVDWASVEPVDILTGGFPCQDVSLAGRRAGLTDGTRSGLWSEFARAIDILRPEMVVIENVRGLLSAEAAGAVEPDPWSMGDGSTRPTLNAFGVVLGDLAGLGYDARWVGLRAADAGAPHGRFRVFAIAHPGGSGSSWWSTRPESVGSNYAALRSGLRGAGTRFAVANSSSNGRGEGWPESAGFERRPDDELGGAAAIADTQCSELERRGNCGDVDGSAREGEGEGDQWERDGDAVGDCGATDWGAYELAIRRWEVATYRVAPAPTEGSARNGAQRLSPVFVEWMMGLAAGHVTNPSIGLTRNEQLKALGNGVVPQQAALALRLLAVNRLGFAA